MARTERGIGASPGLAGLRGETATRETVQRLHEGTVRAGAGTGDGSTRTLSRGGMVYEQHRRGDRWVTFRMRDPSRSRMYTTSAYVTTVAALSSPQ